MKHLLKIKMLLIVLCLGAINTLSYAQNDADPAITSFSFAVSPVTQFNTTTLTLTFLNNGFNSAIPTGSVGVNISLPTSFEYAAFPQSTLAISGTIANKFNFTYDVATNNFFGVTNQAILPGDGGTIVIVVQGLIPVLSRISTANIIRLSPSNYPNENTTNNNLTAAMGVAAGGPLPISLLDFVAVKQPKVVDLNWQTSTEQNSSHFDVEFSKDGSDFKSIGKVNAAGNSSTIKNYTLVHLSPVNGVNYYRLKMVDVDGSFKYSAVRTIKFSSSTSIKIMPNPTADRLYITSNEGGVLQSVGLYSIDGRLLQQVTNFNLGKSIDLSNYAPSIYILRLMDKDGTTEVIRVVKK